MIFHLIVENFGKIKSADIVLGDLVLFVGNNNSGKTLMMQLAYGIRNELLKLSDSLPATKVRKSMLGEQMLLRCDVDWFEEVEAFTNKYFERQKERIITEIFKHPIPISKLQIQIQNGKNTYFVSSISEDAVAREEERLKITTVRYENSKSSGQWETGGSPESGEAEEKACAAVWRILLSNDVSEENRQLFLPASRSGLQLLYRSYFAGDMRGSLVTPVRDYLRFLQLYSENAVAGEPWKSLVEFGEKHLLEGKVVQEGEETFYISEQGRKIPLYIASSMIHELTPIVKALKGNVRAEWLFYDEVENSLHPLIQQEMARWLIRMVNAGMHVIVSTHSDTMASRLNNLLMLSQVGADYEMLSGLQLDRADMLKQDSQVAVYEFQNEPDGSSVAEEISFLRYPLIGYDFKLFGNSLDKLGEEAIRIVR